MRVEPNRIYERVIIATALHNTDMRYMIFSQLQEKHFLGKGRLVYRAMEEEFKRDTHFDDVDLTQSLDNESLQPYLNDLIADMEVSQKRIQNQIDSIQETYSKHELHKRLVRAEKEINDVSIYELIDRLNSVEIASNRVEGANVPDTIAEALEAKDREPLESGDPQLDKMYSGVGNKLGTTEVIIGDAKHGKTAYSIYKASRLAKYYKGLYVILEDTRQSLANKFDIQMQNSPDTANVHIVDIRDGAYTLQSIIHRIKYYKAKYDIKWVCVDYIQRVEVPGAQRFDKIESVSQKLTNVANESDLFMMLLSQPHNINDNRRGYKRMPTVHDADGASAIRKDAFVMTGVFRPRLVPELVIKERGTEMWCQAFGGDDHIPLNSVIVKQLITREGELYDKPLLFEHTDRGLVLTTKQQVDTQTNNQSPF